MNPFAKKAERLPSVVAISEARSDTDRRELMGAIFSRMREGDEAAFKVFRALCSKAIAETRRHYGRAFGNGVLDDNAAGLMPGEYTVQYFGLTERDRCRTRAFLREILPLSGARRFVDAGTGSTAVLAIAAALADPGNKVVALENNPSSCIAASGMAKICGVADQVEVLNEDATRFRPEGKIDVLVSETMNKALTDEPMLAIFANLNRHLAPGGICIPGKLRLYGYLAPEHDRRFYVLETDAESARTTTRHIIPPGFIEIARGQKFTEVDLRMTRRSRVRGDFVQPGVVKPNFLDLALHVFCELDGPTGRQMLGVSENVITDPYPVAKVPPFQTRSLYTRTVGEWLRRVKPITAADLRVCFSYAAGERISSAFPGTVSLALSRVGIASN